MARPSRSSHLAWLAVGAVVALTGCSPILTQKYYAASDGIHVSLGDSVEAQNLLILADAEGSSGVLLGGITNRGTEDAQVTVSLGSESTTFGVDAGQTVLLNGTPDSAGGGSSVELILSAVPVAPGRLTEISLSTAAGGSTSVEVPVLDGTLDPYADFLPSPTVEVTTSAPTEASGA